MILKEEIIKFSIDTWTSHNKVKINDEGNQKCFKY